MSSRRHRGGLGRSRRVRYSGERAQCSRRRHPSYHAETGRPGNWSSPGRRPVRGAGLEVIALTRPRASGRPQTNGEARVRTDAQGRFEIPALAAGKLALIVVPTDGTKLRPSPPAALTVEPGKTTEATIVLEGAPRERTVAGRVVDRKGRPVVRVTVFQSGDSPARTVTETRADGRFELNQGSRRRS